MKTYLRILHYARPLGQYVAPFLVFSILASVFGVLNFTLIQPLLDVLFDKVDTAADAARFSRKPDGFFDIAQWFNYGVGRALQAYGKLGTLRVVCATIVGSVLLSNIFKYLSVRILESFKARTVANLRQAVFDRAVTLHLGFFTSERKGDLMARLTTDVQEVENSVTRVFSAFFREIFTLVFYIVLLFTMSLKLTLFALIIIPVSGSIIALLARKLRENATEVQQRLANLITLLDETFGGIRVVKAFNAETFIRQRFRDENQGYRRSLLRMFYRQELAPPFSEFSGVLVVCGLLLYGGSMVLSNQFELSASTFVTYIIIFSQVLRPAKEISNAVSSVQRGAASAERILTLIDTKSEVTQPIDALEVSGFSDKIELRNVGFSYATGKKVLKNVNLTIQKGKTVALVGSSGGGKSTLADLIPRFYDPTDGQILLDGVDIRTLSKNSLRHLMGIVTQESILFNDTIFNNIAFGSNATLEQVTAAAKIANAHDFIVQTPEGYQTFIGDRGTRLSGGQRQRLSIARAVLKNPPILILDEATSSLDTESEKLVQEAIANLMKNRTALVIAHRLSTIQHADEIVVLHQGQIVERGTHEELLELEKGFYRRLSRMQVQTVG